MTAPPQIRIIEVKDIFTKSTIIPTSATVFRDRLTGFNNLAITAVNVQPNNADFGEIIVGFNNGTSMSRFGQFVATPGATNLLSGDFNNDGFDDLVYIDCLLNLAVVALNNGANSFFKLEFRETGG